MKAGISNLIKYENISKIISFIEAPFTLRKPISLVRCAAMELIRPNNPSEATIMAKSVNADKILLNLISSLYCLSKYSLLKK